MKFADVFGIWSAKISTSRMPREVSSVAVGLAMGVGPRAIVGLGEQLVPARFELAQLAGLGRIELFNVLVAGQSAEAVERIGQRQHGDVVLNGLGGSGLARTRGTGATRRHGTHLSMCARSGPQRTIVC